MTKYALASLLALAALAAPRAESLRIVVPYLGAVTSTYEDSDRSLDLDGTGLMEGLYFQWVDPELFQANAFVYYAADVMDAPVLGGHLIADVYPWSDPFGKVVLGAGIDVLQPGASTSVLMGPPPPVTIDVTPTIVAPYARAGHYLYFGSRDRVLLSLLPWAGAEVDFVRTTVDFDPEMMGMVDQETNDRTLYGLAGLNVDAVFMHFLEVEVKYRLTFNADDALSTFDGMANLFLTRAWGLSYRFKYMESTSGSVSYHIAGVAYLF